MSHLQLVEELLLLGDEVNFVDHKVALLVQAGNYELVGSELLSAGDIYARWPDCHLLQDGVGGSVVRNVQFVSFGRSVELGDSRYLEEVEWVGVEMVLDLTEELKA